MSNSGTRSNMNHMNNYNAAIDVCDMSYLYSIYSTKDKNILLSNFIYPSYDIDIKKATIKKLKLDLRYKLEKEDSFTRIIIFNGKHELKTYSISNNLMKTYQLIYGKVNIKPDVLIKALSANLFIQHNDLHYCFSPTLYDTLTDLNFSYNLMDDMNSLFYNYGSINFFERHFNSIGNIFGIKLYMGNYFITVPNDQLIFEKVITYVNAAFKSAQKIILVGIYYPSLVNGIKSIDDTTIKSLKPVLIKKYKITTKYIYDYYDRTKFYNNSSFELVFFCNLFSVDVDSKISEKYNNYINIINKLSTKINKLNKPYNEKNIKL